MTIQQFTMTHPPAWRHQHRALDVIALICLACGVILLLDGVRYTRRLRRLDGGHPANHQIARP